MNPTYEKIDDLTFKISGTTPYEQIVTKDQLNARIKEIDSNIEWFNSRIAELEAAKVEVQALITKADELWLVTENEKQEAIKLEVVIDPIEIPWTWDLVK